MACTCGPGQECQPLKPGCWGYEPAQAISDRATILRIVQTLDRLASLVECMADTTPDDRDRVAARDIAMEAATLRLDVIKLVLPSDGAA